MVCAHLRVVLSVRLLATIWSDSPLLRSPFTINCLAHYSRKKHTAGRNSSTADFKFYLKRAKISKTKMRSNTYSITLIENIKFLFLNRIQLAFLIFFLSYFKYFSIFFKVYHSLRTVKSSTIEFVIETYIAFLFLLN